MNANKPAGRLSIPKSFLSFFMRIKNQLRFAWQNTTGEYLWNLTRIYSVKVGRWIKNQLRLTWRRIINIFNAKDFLVVIGILIFCVLVILVLRIFDIWVDTLDAGLGIKKANGILSIKTQTIRMLGLTLFGLSGMLGLIVAYSRTQALFQANRDKVFTDAINHLGKDNSASVRLGGIYGLYNLIGLEPERLPNITNILCAHLRETTQHPEYRKQYKNKPSNEIQSLLDVLGKINTKLQNSDLASPPLDLSDSYLCGADLKEINLSGARLDRARLECADLSGANLNKASLEKAKLREAKLRQSDLQSVDFSGASLQGANLSGASLQGANLGDANLKGASLESANLQGVNLGKASLQGANLEDANLKGASLESANLQGVNLGKASLQGAYLIGVSLQGAYLGDASLQGAYLLFASLQGTNFRDAGLEGANLRKAGMQGADLTNANLQGANLTDTGLQGANLGEASLEGAFSSPRSHLIVISTGIPELFLINEGRGKNTELTRTVFSGGISANEFNSIKQNLTKSGMESVRINEIMARIRPHMGKKKSFQLPSNSGATTGVLTDKMADQIIKYYKETMQLVLKYW